MLLVDKSITKSSKSDTSDGILTPVQFVKGVGPRLGSVFASRDIATVKDLLTFFPRAYEDRTRILTIKELQEGQRCTVSVKILSARKARTRQGRTTLEVRCTDDTGVLTLKWFHVPYGLDSRFTAGSQHMVTGPVTLYLGQPQMVHPEINKAQADATEPNVGRIIPVYSELDGIPSRTFRKVLWEALEKFSARWTEDLPARFLNKHKLPSARAAIRELHFPSENSPIPELVAFNTPSHWRLVYEEFFKFEFLILRRRLRMEREVAPSYGNSGGIQATRELEKLLPFELTGDQKSAVSEILSELGHRSQVSLHQSTHQAPMNRLTQGDVGSGKTVVAFLASACVLAEGGQVALMAPTEILAEQHFKNAVKLFGGRLRVALLTGKTPQSERNALYARLKSGEPTLLIGTHALIEDPVEFSELGLIIIDEQHRFGVEQRRTLRKKGVRVENGKNLIPHLLLMTATPIPRTLALTAYGDLATTLIREMPPGRKPIKTEVISGAGRAHAMDTIRAQLRAGRQAYFIYPLVNESEAEGFTEMKSATLEAERLAQVFSEFKVGLLHGQMRPDGKASVMESFKQGVIHILVSTTVVEVGVDVPNATVIAIEHSERFGLSQLHQLRGRVGRGSHQSYCYLLTSGFLGESTAHRLEVLEQTQDGFKIAEADLEIRGPGEFLGTRQAGGLPFRLANLVRDREWLLRARDDASELIQHDPELLAPEQGPLRAYFEREGHLQAERLKTS